MKRILFVGLIAGLGLNVMAQSMEQGGVDTVTVGSTVAYAVDPDPAIAADVNMGPSTWDWYFSNGGTIITAGSFVNGTTAADDSINIQYTNATLVAGVSIDVITSEVSHPLFGAGCTGQEDTVGVFFVNAPSVTLVAGSTGGCGITQDTVPLTLVGYGPFNVTFTVSRNLGLASTYTETVGAVSDQGTSSLDLILNTTDHLNDGGGTTTGRYDIVITGVTDRFSRKSMVAIAGTVTSGTFTIGINPVPTTQPIRHIRNIGN